MSLVNNYKVYVDGNFDDVITGNVDTAALEVGKLTYPNVDGTAGQVLATNGNGVLGFITPTGGNVTGPGSSTNNAVPTFNGTTGKVLQNSLVTISPAGLVDAVNLTVGGLVYPATDNTAGDVLTTNGSGVLSLQPPAGNVTGPGSSTNTAIALWNGTTGKVIENSVVTVSGGGNIVTAGSIHTGALTYPITDNTSGDVITTNGAGILSLQPIPYQIQRLIAGVNIGSYQTSNIGDGDHVPFNVVVNSTGSSITMDVSSSYTTVLNTASIGRFTLVPGTYVMMAYIQFGVTFNDAVNGSVGFQFRNSDSGATLGYPCLMGASYNGTNIHSGINGSTVVGYATPVANTRYEVELSSVVGLASISLVWIDIMRTM